MTWHLKKIPKIAHFFWDDRPMSFLRWMTLRSFAMLNPTWKLKLHMSKTATGPGWRSPNNKQTYDYADYRGMLSRVPRLTIVPENRYPNMHGVHQSDILRNIYLSGEGGIWSDVDILFYRPIDLLLANAPENSNHTCGLCNYPRWMPIGFLMSAPGDPYYTKVAEVQNQIFKKSPGGEYQKFGTGVYKNVLANGDYKFFNLAMHEVYQIHWSRALDVFVGKYDISKGIGLHWYGGSAAAREFEPKINQKNWTQFPIRNILEPSLK